MPQDLEIETYLLKTNKLFLLAFSLMLFMLTGLIFTILLIRSYGEFSLTTLLIGILLFFISPLVFVNKKITLFSKKVIIKLTSNLLKIAILNKSTNDLEEQYEYLFCDIKSFQIGKSGTNNSSYIKLVLDNGEKVKYSFFEQSDNEENVLKNVQLFFAAHNKGKNVDQKINILPTFYTTKEGKYSIIGLTVLLGIVLLLQIIYKPQTIPLSFVTSLVMYSRIKAQQKSDISIQEKFEQL